MIEVDLELPEAGQLSALRYRLNGTLLSGDVVRDISRQVLPWVVAGQIPLLIPL